jgi:hypothetical protein
MKEMKDMILRSRSSTKLSSSHEWNLPCDTPASPVNSSMKGIPGGSKLWRMLAILFVIAVVFYITLFENLFEIEESNTPSNPKRRQLTVVLNTFKRHDLMKGTFLFVFYFSFNFAFFLDAINHYSKCSVVKHIHIIWSEKELPSEKLVSQYKHRDMPSVSFE